MADSSAAARRRNVRVILQARTTSSRLPAKSLLPVGGIPLAVLCARRLKRTGADVVLATSDRSADDLLASTAAAAGVAVFRGSLADVLSRFVACARDLADDDVLVRMTADNPVPDADFIDDLLDAFIAQNVVYLGSRWPEDGLPYGLGGEVFTVGALRRAQERATPYESEHVTPRLAAGQSVGVLTGSDLGIDSDKASLRCTIDSLDDYLAMARVFAQTGDPVQTDWRSIVQALADGTRNAVTYCTASGERRTARIAVGTAQFGMDYGIANQTGCPSDDDIEAIIRIAAAAGATYLDTARAYGEAERRLGQLFQSGRLPGMGVVSKVAPLTSLPRTASASAVASAVDASVFRSCHALRRHRIDVMMMHRFADTLRWKGAALGRLSELRNDDVVGDIGVSVYTPAEAIQCLADERVGHLQIPFNLLDARWLSERFQAALRQRPSVTIHARSVFLQGLLINEPYIWPGWFQRSEEFVDTIRQLCVQLGRRSPVDLCMAYVRAWPWVSTLVLGAELPSQMEELATLATNDPLSLREAAIVRDAFRAVPARLLNPASWQ
jgi:spore coat polysaccharide biosynthesis protein SpsF